jgi:hypothetical protein
VQVVVSKCVEYLLPRYKKLSQEYSLQKYPTPRDLLLVLGNREYSIASRLTVQPTNSATVSALSLVFAPILSRYFELIERLEICTFTLVWEQSQNALSECLRPDVEFERRVRDFCGNLLSKNNRYQQRMAPLSGEELAPFHHPEQRLILQEVMQKLPAKSQAMLVGSVLYGLTSKELGEWFSMREENSRKTKLRALGKARDLYQSDAVVLQ